MRFTRYIFRNEASLTTLSMSFFLIKQRLELLYVKIVPYGEIRPQSFKPWLKLTNLEKAQSSPIFV
jgi:hypothetical protein